MTPLACSSGNPPVNAPNIPSSLPSSVHLGTGDLSLSHINKQVHIIPHREQDDLPFFSIDIAREDFPEPKIEEVYPESLTDGDVSRGELRGHSKILFNAVSFLRRKKTVGKGALPPPLEFLTPRQSAQVIRNMVEIKECLRKSYAREHKGRDPFVTALVYPAGIRFLDEEKQRPILSPFFPDEEGSAAQARS